MKMASQPKPTALALTLFLSLFLLLCAAFAASGGRMGGDSFSNKSPSKSGSGSSSSDDYYYSPPSNFRYRHHHEHYHYHGGIGGGRGYDSFSFHHVDEKSDAEGRNKDNGSSIEVVVFVVGVVLVFVYFHYRQSRGSVVMVQVGLSGEARSLQEELNEIAKTTDTSSPEGWQHILAETTVALLRHPQYFISGYSSVKQHWTADSVEKGFRDLSSEEREKMNIESLVNVNNVKRQIAVNPKAIKLCKDYIVVTILVAVKGSYRVPAIKSIDDAKDALRSLNFGSSKNIQAIEVLWTPQDKNDTLSDEELLENYPLLRPI